jgi:hypothetical protein
MSEVDRHIMLLERTCATGVEEWACPTCGRRFVAQWSPEIRRLILEPGDLHATHTGGDLSLSLSVDSQAADHAPPLTDAEANSAWARWLDALDFDSTGPDNDTPEKE